MKITATFNLDDHLDRVRFDSFNKSTRRELALYDMAVLLREANKYQKLGDAYLQDDLELALVNELHSKFWDIMKKHSLDPFDEELSL